MSQEGGLSGPRDAAAARRAGRPRESSEIFCKILMVASAIHSCVTDSAGVQQVLGPSARRQPNASHSARQRRGLELAGRASAGRHLWAPRPRGACAGAGPPLGGGAVPVQPEVHLNAHQLAVHLLKGGAQPAAAAGCRGKLRQSAACLVARSRVLGAAARASTQGCRCMGSGLTGRACRFSQTPTPTPSHRPKHTVQQKHTTHP